MYIVSDVDECAVLNGGCDHNCTDSEGGYECSCRDGYILESDNTTCVDVNECLSSPCVHSCTNLLGGFHCECPKGYNLHSNGISCNGIL